MFSVAAVVREITSLAHQHGADWVTTANQTPRVLKRHLAGAQAGTEVITTKAAPPNFSIIFLLLLLLVWLAVLYPSFFLSFLFLIYLFFSFFYFLLCVFPSLSLYLSVSLLCRSFSVVFSDLSHDLSADSVAFLCAFISSV